MRKFKVILIGLLILAGCSQNDTEQNEKTLTAVLNNAETVSYPSINITDNLEAYLESHYDDNYYSIEGYYGDELILRKTQEQFAETYYVFISYNTKTYEVQEITRIKSDNAFYSSFTMFGYGDHYYLVEFKATNEMGVMFNYELFALAGENRILIDNGTSRGDFEVVPYGEDSYLYVHEKITPIHSSSAQENNKFCYGVSQLTGQDYMRLEDHCEDIDLHDYYIQSTKNLSGYGQSYALYYRFDVKEVYTKNYLYSSMNDEEMNIQGDVRDIALLEDKVMIPLANDNLYITDTEADTTERYTSILGISNIVTVDQQRVVMATAVGNMDYIPVIYRLDENRSLEAQIIEGDNIHGNFIEFFTNAKGEMIIRNGSHLILVSLKE